MKIHVSFDQEIPDGATDEQITEWLEFELSTSGTTSAVHPDNPLYGVSLDAKLDVIVWNEE